jgi:hypothetical protein
MANNKKKPEIHQFITSLDARLIEHMDCYAIVGISANGDPVTLMRNGTPTQQLAMRALIADLAMGRNGEE